MDYYGSAESCIETVRALHQTIASLRTALEESRSEVSDLKSRNVPRAGDAVRNLSIENRLPYGPKSGVRVSTDTVRPFIAEKQLSTSRTVTFSNTFDGDNRVSSSNTLHIKSLRKRAVSDDRERSRELPKFKDEVVDSKTNIVCSKTNARGGIDLDKAKHLGHVIEAAINKISKKRSTDKRPSITKRKLSFDSKLNKSEGSRDAPKQALNENLKVVDKDPKIIENRGFSGIEGNNPVSDDLKENQEEPVEVECEKNSTKQVEFSVKVSKKPTKLINIDIQTKYKKKKRKTATKMGDKQEQKPKEETVVPPLDLRNLTNVDETTENDAEQEVDDIELIFTTDETKETDFKEELVPIDALLQCPLSDYDEKLSADASDRELEDDVFNEPEAVRNSRSDNSVHEGRSLRSYYSFQDSSFESKSLEKDESFDRFEERARTTVVETDISKVGIQDGEYNPGRRNTCPNPVQYRPIAHREALGRGARKARPVVAHPHVRRDSEAQTNISAVPGSSWRSESSLAHKVKIGDNFTTLPSKFPHPGSRLQLSEKTVEARRVLLSDIGFTSMVPELSRSADHLCPPNLVRSAAPTTYGQFLRTTDLYSPAYTQTQKCLWTTMTPSDKSNSQSRYSSQFISSPPTLARRCSAPVSPSKRPLRTAASRVRFANGSLPELRTDWTTIDSGESTDSLVEEAEHYLRRSIDCLALCHNVCFKSESSKTNRRASAPEPSRDNVPPQGWQPFLPRIPRDLHLDYWVKVITAEGRVRGGRVRYVGPLLNQAESYVGVQLSNPDGQSDGTYNSRRYFNCEPYHGLFIPFKKIIMGWRP